MRNIPVECHSLKAGNPQTPEDMRPSAPKGYAFAYICPDCDQVHITVQMGRQFIALAITACLTDDNAKELARMLRDPPTLDGMKAAGRVRGGSS